MVSTSLDSEFKTSHYFAEVAIRALWVNFNAEIEPFSCIHILSSEKMTTTCVVNAAIVFWVDFNS